MIKILNSNFERQAILKQAINPNRFEEINGENTLTFSAILDEKTSEYINENAVIELDDDYFDIAYFQKNQNEDGTLTIDVETEHISYRLNNPEYNLEYFAATGTPSAILASLLNGTGFTVGTVEFSGNVTYSIQEEKSRRMMLMEFASLLGGELDFDKFEISILQHRGSTEPKILAKGKNIKIISKIFNKRETDENGNPLISYTCSPIMFPDEPLTLGDVVLLIQKDLGIREQLRIVRLGWNPYDPIEAEIELANFVSSLEDDIYRIKTSTVVKDKVYNGCRIGPEEGFVAERSDGKAKTVMNATEGISIYTDTGNGYQIVFEVDTNGRIRANKIDIGEDGTFGGRVAAQHVIINNNQDTGSLNFRINNTYVTLKSNYTTGGNTLIIGKTTNIGAMPSMLERMDIMAGWLYVYNNLYVQNSISIGGSNVATESYVLNQLANHVLTYHS